MKTKTYLAIESSQLDVILYKEYFCDNNQPTGNRYLETGTTFQKLEQ